MHLPRNLKITYYIIYHSFYLITVTNPMQLIVAFKGKLKAALKFLPGTYTRTPNDEYENFWAFDSGSTAIWYDSKLGRWIFGRLDLDSGPPKTWIYSEDDVTSPQVATNWKSRHGRHIESDNILVQRLVESGT